jgi:hypothetical protein
MCREYFFYNPEARMHVRIAASVHSREQAATFLAPFGAVRPPLRRLRLLLLLALLLPDAASTTPTT